ncbi:MAG TPA: SH3 domain-containing protein [Polyangiaceae bacterium]|nr:SH3 domain-containing protein [Polyangiaceae bacterium]
MPGLNWRALAVAAPAGALMACSLLKKPEPTDGGENTVVDGGAAPSPVHEAEAVNASEMTRYTDEKPVDHAPITAESGGNMRTQAGTGGDLVVVLKRGTEVEKLAEHGAYYLVLADDPKEGSRKLMGWIAETAFTGGPEPHRAEPEERDGGHPRPTPGPVIPAPPAPHVVDAGAKPASGPAKPFDVHKTDGACPPGYGPCSAVCRLTCRTQADCGDPAALCSAGFCLGPRAVPCK